MAFKDLNQYLVNSLELPLNGTTYMVPPPTKERGLTLASFIALGLNNAHGADTDDDTLDLVKGAANESLADLSLTPDVHAQMVADSVPAMHIDQAAIYALYYWTLGEEQADLTFQLLYAEVPAGDLPKGLKLVKTGRNTASENLTKTASTPATESRPTPQDHKPASPKKQASRGKKPSPIGD